MQPVPHTQFPYIIRLAATVIVITLVVYWLHITASVATLLVFSIILSMAMFPFVKWLEKRKFPRVAAILSAILIFALVIIGFGMVLAKQANEFLHMWPQIDARLQECIQDVQVWGYKKFNILPSEQMSKFQEYTKSMGKGDAGKGMVGTAVSTTGSMLATLSILPVFIFFILYYRDMLKEFLFRVFSNVRKTQVSEVLSRIYEVVHNYLSGLMLVTIIVGVLNSIGLLILGIKSAIFFGFLASLLLIIPYFGIMIGAILPIVVALVTKDSPMYALGVAGVFFFVQMLEGNLITPYIVGSKISVNALAAIVALFLGEMLWGIAGMALALPLTAILKVILDSVESLKPYGFLLGDYEINAKREQKSQKIHKMEKDIEETLQETKNKIKSVFKKSKVNQKTV